MERAFLHLVRHFKGLLMPVRKWAQEEAALCYHRFRVALAAFIWRAWRPYDAVLGRVDGLKGYHDMKRHPEGKRVPGLVLFRWDAPLFFANAQVFHDHILAAVASAPTRTRWVVVAAEPVTDIDVTAADVLSDLDQDSHNSGQ